MVRGAGTSSRWEDRSGLLDWRAMPKRSAVLGMLVSAMCAGLALASNLAAQTLPFERLPASELAVMAPSERVMGAPGSMRIAITSCTAADEPNVRRRILDIAVQEWGYFGFPVVDETLIDDDRDRGRGLPRRFTWLDPAESARVAASIAGYWAATRDGGWILARQNDHWNGPEGIGARWRDPWSAAFISWVMCESGLGSDERFRRHIAHHVYIDQAIEARDDPDSAAAYAAYDVGELPLEPGDLVCRARRGAYRSIAERRRDLGVGVRSHCDIVVDVEPEHGRVLAIGGNVRGRVSLKFLPATFRTDGVEHVATSIGRGGRIVFAHLKLRAPSIEAGALAESATLRALSARTNGTFTVERLLAREQVAPGNAFDSAVQGGDVAASP